MGRYEDLKKKLGERYEIFLGTIGMTEDDLKKKAYRGIGAGAGKWKKSGFHISWPMRIFIIFLLVFQAFFPFKVFEATWKIGLILGVILFALIALAILAPQILGSVGAGGGVQIIQFIIALVLIFMILLTAQIFNCGESTCYHILSLKLGTTIALSIFLGLLGLGMLLIAWPLDGSVFLIGIIIFGAILFFVIPYFSNPTAYFQACSKIPYLAGTAICKSREVYVEELKTVKIPVAGGITLKFGTEETNWQPVSTLYAGEPYEFTFTLTNYYEQPITFELKPSMLSSYGSKVEFVQQFDQRTNSLKPREYYQDSVFMDPEKMTVKEKESSGCPYTEVQINKALLIPVNEIKCARDKLCENPKYGCIKIGNFECNCVDWTLATCSKNSLKAKMEVKHTGFFRGNASLYYSKELTSPQLASELYQGPLAVIIEFQPNPYISTIHQYRQDVSMYVTFKNHGGDITIKDFKVLPQNTIVHTTEKETGMELIEEVGTQVIECRNIEEIIPSGFLPNGEEASGKLCTLTPPSIKTTLKDLTQGQITEESNVRYDRMNYYCDKLPTEAEQTGQESWSSNWDKIYQGVKTSGVCEINQGKETKEKVAIQSSLAYTEVIVEFTYERTAPFTSDDIIPYTRTEECMKLEEAAQSTSTTTTTLS